MTKSRKRRTGSGYKASVAWVTRPGTGMPDCHSERHAGRSDGSGRRRHVLPREVSGSVPNIGLPYGQPSGTEQEKSAEAIVAEIALIPRRAESSNAGSRLRDSRTGLAANSVIPHGMRCATARWPGGTDLPRSRRLYQFTASCQKRALAPHGAPSFEETAVYIQVRTVVWEDGAVRPLLPDRPPL